MLRFYNLDVDTKQGRKTPRNDYVYFSWHFCYFALYLQQRTSSPVTLSQLSGNRCYGLWPLLTSLIFSQDTICCSLFNIIIKAFS